jgi:hypothetical protein
VSLLSVYLIALWVLTYFGRPFGKRVLGNACSSRYPRFDIQSDFVPTLRQKQAKGCGTRLRGEHADMACNEFRREAGILLTRFI